MSATQIEQEMYLQIGATGYGGEFWSERIPLDATVSNGTRVTTTATFDAQNISERKQQVASELDGTGGVSVSLVVETRYLHDGDFEAKTFTIPMSISSKTYGFLPAESGREVEHLEKNTAVKSEPHPFWWVYFLVGGIFVMLAVGLWMFRRQYGIPCDWDVNLARHSDWLSEGEIQSLQVDNEVEMKTIPSVVDMAIDLRKRAVYDSRVEVVFVVDDTNTAYYVTDENNPWTPRAPFKV